VFIGTNDTNSYAMASSANSDASRNMQDEEMPIELQEDAPPGDTQSQDASTTTIETGKLVPEDEEQVQQAPASSTVTKEQSVKYAAGQLISNPRSQWHKLRVPSYFLEEAKRLAQETGIQVRWDRWPAPLNDETYNSAVQDDQWPGRELELLLVLTGEKRDWAVAKADGLMNGLRISLQGDMGEEILVKLDDRFCS